MSPCNDFYVACVGVMLGFIGTNIDASEGCSDKTVIGAFSAGDLAEWQKQEFSGETHYQLVTLSNQKVLRARSSASASGLIKYRDIDLLQTPFLHWSWQVKDLPINARERSKQGDDFPVRVYLVFSTGPFFWQTRALNYVWSSSQPLASHWPNPYTSNTHMLAVESGSSHVNQWRSYQRNMYDDIREYFGMEITRVQAIAIMTDSDNRGNRYEAYYGDICVAKE